MLKLYIFKIKHGYGGVTKVEPCDNSVSNGERGTFESAKEKLFSYSS